MAPVPFSRAPYNNTHIEAGTNGSPQQCDMIPFGEFLFNRLHSIGCKSVFGVPGDFNLPLLEHLYDESVTASGLRWIGNCNELNAAYSADGYSRYSNKIGALITTYGVGELSAINGIAGAFAENVKVLHIVGIPSTKSIDPHFPLGQQNLHHLVPQLHDSNWCPPNHKVYFEMIKDRISCSTAYIENSNNACDEVDRVIKDILRYSKPGYIFVPQDMSDQLVSNKNLIDTPTIDLKAVLLDKTDPRFSKAAQKVCEWLYQSRTPAILADVLTDRYGLNVKLNQFVMATKIWNFSTIMGKSILDETNPYYMGMYVGAEGQPAVKQLFESCDLILHYGKFVNEINSGHNSFTYSEHAKIIELNPDYIRFIDTTKPNETQTISNIGFAGILEILFETINVSKLDLRYDMIKLGKSVHEHETLEEINSEDSQITQKFVQRHISSSYFNAGDIIVADTGAFQFAMRDIQLPTQSKYITQGFYLSIGMALPAAFGIGIAMQDYPKNHLYPNDPRLLCYQPRLILLEGDGAAQMTIQEISGMLRYQVPIEIVIWNNNGYTIERAIMGPTRSYNDIMAWNWTKLFEAFGDFDLKYTSSEKAKTKEEMLNCFEILRESTNRNRINLLEVQLGALDYPKQLKKMIGRINSLNKSCVNN